MTKLRKALKKAGISQSELARRTGINAPGINRYVTGCQWPNEGTLEKLSRALGVEPEAIREVRP